jgi:hypothetical protein
MAPDQFQILPLLDPWTAPLVGIVPLMRATPKAVQPPHIPTPNHQQNHPENIEHLLSAPLQDPWTAPTTALDNHHLLGTALTTMTMTTALQQPHTPTTTHQPRYSDTFGQSAPLPLRDKWTAPTSLTPAQDPGPNSTQDASHHRVSFSTRSKLLPTNDHHTQTLINPYNPSNDPCASLAHSPAPQIAPIHLTPKYHRLSEETETIATTDTMPRTHTHHPIPLNTVPTYSDNNLPFGDFTHPKKQKHTKRFYSININGLRMSRDIQKVTYIAQQTTGSAIDVLGLIATDTNWTSEYKAKFTAAFRPFVQRSKIHFSSNPTPTSRCYQPGGNCIISMDDINIFVTNHASDAIGRWAITFFEPTPDTSFAYITAYCPTKEARKSAIHTSWRQQYLHFLQKGVDSPDPVQLFFRDLQHRIQTITQQGYNILLAIDANSSDDSPNAHMNSLMHHTNLIDLIVAKHPYSDTHQMPNTHIRGSQRIDFLCCSQELVHTVERVGYDAFGEIYDSDHRGMSLDIDWSKLCGTNTPNDIVPHKSLSFRRKDHIHTYKATLMSYFTDHNVAPRITRLQDMITSHTDRSSIIREVEKLDQDFTRGMLSAERACKGRYHTPFSSKVVNLRKIVGYWNLVWRSTRTKQNLSKQIQDLADRIVWPDLPPPLSPSVTEIRNHRKSAITELHDSLRLSQRESSHRLFDAFQHSNDNAQISWTQVSQFELQKKIKSTYTRFRSSRNLVNTGGLSTVSVPDGQNWRRLTDPNDIASAIFERNIRHFSQADRTPFTDSIISSTISNMTRSPVANVCNALQDLLPLPATQLLQECSKFQLPIVDSTIQAHEIRKYFSKWKETTTTSPSGRTLIHYKMMLLRDTEESLSLGTTFWDGISTILNACIIYSHPLHRWQTVFNTMIYKKQGDDRIDKMRVIHIFEADYNMLLGIIWRRVQDNAEHHSVLGNQQWGSRAGRTCEDVLAIKMWSHELSKLTRTTLGTFENDAKSCYDRIVMDFSMLRSRQLGLPASFVTMYTDALHHSKFYFSSRGNTDERFYSPSTGFKVYGPGQGSTAATYSWTNTSTCAMQVLGEYHNGATFCTPDQHNSTHRVIEAIVDDTSITTNKFLEELEHNRVHGWNHTIFKSFASTCVEDMTDTAQHWEQLLWSTGGALELSKCWYYLTHWNFDRVGNAYMLHPDQMRHFDIPPIQLSNSAGGSYPISHLPPTISQRTLGFMSCPSGQQNGQVIMLTNKARELARALRATYVTEPDARKFYSTVAIPSLTYANCVSCLSQKQCDKLDSILLQAFVPKMGYKSSSPYAVLQGPSLYQGQQLTPLWSRQGAAQILLLVESLRRTGPKHSMAVANMEWLHAFVGTTSHPFCFPNDDYPPIPEGWLSTLLTFLKQSNVSLHIQAKKIHLRRQRDQILMDRAVIYTQNREILKNINQCRLYLQAETLSDVCTAQGDRLHPLILDHFSAVPLSRPNKFFPIQAKPGHRPWIHFTAFLRTCFCGNPRANQLSNHLGRWTIHHKLRTWNAYYHPANKQVWIPWNATRWHIHAIISERHSMNFQVVDPVVQYRSVSASSDLIPVDTFHGGIQFSLPKLSLRTLEPETENHLSTPSNLQETIDNGSPFQKWCLNYLRETSPPPTCILKLDRPSIAIAMLETNTNNTKQIAVSWRIHSGATCYWQNKIWLQGSRDPRRAYALGLLSLLQLISFEHDCFGDTTRDCTLNVYIPNAWLKRKVDNLVKFYGHWTRQTFLLPHFDLLQDIATTIVSLHLQLRIQPDLEASELIHAYRCALIDCKNLKDTHPQPPMDLQIPVPSCHASIFVRHQLITANEKKQIQNILPSYNISTYYQQKYKWDQATYDDIDWISQEKASNKLNRSKFVTKLSCDWLPTNYRLNLVEGISPQCALCCEIETNDHLFCCPARTTYRTKFHTSLQEKLAELKTPLHITNLILTALSRLPQDIDIDLLPHSQNSIGWNKFLKGFISQQFRSETPQYWPLRITFFLLSQAHNLWLQRCDENTQKNNGATDSQHLKNRMRAKITEIYSLASHLPPEITAQILPTTAEDFFQSHRSHAVTTWYLHTKPAIQACLRRHNIHNDLSRLSPNHPTNIRVPPDGIIDRPLMSHFMPQV